MGTPEIDFDVVTPIAHVSPLVGMGEKAAPRRAALVVIDMQNDFIAKQGLIPRQGRDVSQAMAHQLPKLARDAGVFVVFVRNVYTTENSWSALRADGIRTIALTGAVSNVCVETSAREAFGRDYDRGRGERRHRCSPADHEMNLGRPFGEVTSIAELQSLWAPRNGAEARRWRAE